MDFTADVEHVFRIVPESTATEDDSLDNLSLNPVELAPPYGQNTAQLVRSEANSHNHIPPIALGPSGGHYTLLLNNRYVLKKPGVLQLTIVSHRVSADLGDTTANANRDAVSAPPFPVTSNTLTITILPPTLEWQAAELANIEKQLDTNLPNASGAPSPERQQAINRLMYLNSPAAARELVRRFAPAPPIEQDEFATGLLLSDHRAAAIEMANKLADDPSFGITFEFQTLVALLPVMDKMGELESGEANAALVSAVAAAKTQFLAELNSKQGKAFETTLETLERMKADSPSAADATALQQAVPKLIGMFHDLPPDEQQNWLEQNWSDVKDPAWTPVLRAIATSPPASTTQYLQGFAIGVKSEALEDWAQLDPQGARETILAAMMSNDPQFGANALSALPDKTLPDAQQRQLGQLFLVSSDPEAQRHFAGMLERYGGETAWKQISSAVAQSMRLYTCDTQVALLNFAFGVAPDSAGDLLETAMTPPDNGSTDCRAQILSASIQNDTKNAREKYAIAVLNDSNPSVVGAAARYLALYGSADAEDPLWKRYEAWALAASPIASTAHENPQATEIDDFHLGGVLADALIQGRGWLTGREKLERLNTLAGNILGRPVVSNYFLSEWMRSPVALSCFTVTETESQFNIAQYTMTTVDELKARLALFPSGTTLAWYGHECSSAPTYTVMFNDVASAASLKGVTLKPVADLPPVMEPADAPATNEGNGNGDSAPDPATAPSNDESRPPSPDAEYIVPDRVVVVN
jgi:hypothetical protein